MRVEVNGVRLFVDFDGAGLVADGPVMREKPVLILLHGGPGADHSIYKPAYGDRLSDLCQILYLDHRGNGRSDDGDPALWTLDQWADDIAALCGALEIERPFVFGASFGGFVAQAVATRHPDLPRGLILANTAARVDFERIYAAFDRIGGAAAGAAARAYWGKPTPATRQAYAETCLGFYATGAPDPELWARIIKKDPVALHFNGPANEMGRFDFRERLAALTCPSLVIAGAVDPIMPPEFSVAIAESLRNSRAEHHCLDGAAHMAASERADTYFALLRGFIERTLADG